MSDTDLSNYKWKTEPYVVMCHTCNTKPAVRLYVGTVDGPYWCSIECKERWLLPTPADAIDPAGEGTPAQAADLCEAYERLMARRG